VPQPREYQTEAIIIKKTKLGEADRILTFYTPGFGKMQAVAKGVRKPKSKMAGHLELLTHSQINLIRGHNLATVTGAQTITAFLPLKEDLDLASCGLYLAELVCQFAPDEETNQEIFHLLLDTMNRLCSAANRDVILRYFEMQMLNESGYRPELRNCVACRKPLEPVVNYFSFQTGGMLCPGCARDRSDIVQLSVNALKVLRLLQDRDMATAEKVKYGQELSLEIESVIRRYIRFILEKEVKSAAWLDNLKQAPPPPLAP
jgi:DNA repair protein RecO (recombination protein O)